MTTTVQVLELLHIVRHTLALRDMSAGRDIDDTSLPSIRKVPIVPNLAGASATPTPCTHNLAEQQANLVIQRVCALILPTK